MKLALVSLLIVVFGAYAALAQQGVAERLGQKIDEVGRGVKEGVREVSDSVRKRFEVVQADVQRMGVHPRVYARLHWDKNLHGSKIEVHMFRGGVVLLRGMVPDAEAKKRAVTLAAETVDVSEVIDELTTRVTYDDAKASRPKTTR
jgi:osmotically-inducible protein OsmY